MTEGEALKDSRAAHVDRLRRKYPERKFDDDESIFSQTGEDYDQYEKDLSTLKDREKKLSDLFASNPRSATYLQGMARGEDPVLGLVRTFGVEIKDVLDDPEKQEEIARANKEYLDRVAQNRSLEEEYNKNLDATLSTLERFQQERGMSDEEVDRTMDFLLTIVRDGVMGKFSPASLDMACKAINHDADVAVSREEGEVAGRNAKIEEKLRRASHGDGTEPLGGKNGRGDAVGGKNMFDLAREAL